MSRTPDRTDTINEKDTPALSFTLRDEDGTAIPSASVTTLTVTIYEVSTNAIVNSRDGQNILNANGGTLHATSGAFEFQTSIADTTLVLSPVKSLEAHDVLLVWTYDAGAKRGSYKWRLNIPNETRVS